MNLTEAFKALDNLEEDVFSVNDEGIEKLQNFIKNDDSVDELNVYDLDVEDDTKKELEACHVGDVILDCCVCHSKIFKPISEVVINDEKEVANEGEECPYCYSVDGFKVVGEVTPLENTEDVEVEIEDKDVVEEDIDQVDVSTDDVDIEIEDRDDESEQAVEDEVVVEESRQRDKWNKGKKTITIKESDNQVDSYNFLITKKRYYYGFLSEVEEVNEYFNVSGYMSLSNFVKKHGWINNRNNVYIPTDVELVPKPDLADTYYVVYEINVGSDRTLLPIARYEQSSFDKYTNFFICKIYTFDQYKKQLKNGYREEDLKELEEQGAKYVVSINSHDTPLFLTVFFTNLEDAKKYMRSKDYDNTQQWTLLESTKSNPGLVTKKGSIANLLANHMDELQNVYDVNELKNKVIDLVDNSDIADTKGAKDFKYRVLSQRTADHVLSTIGAYMSGISTREKNESKQRIRNKKGCYFKESMVDETIGDKLRKYQMWVDYDIKHYGKISKTTQDIIDKEGLQLIKDDHGDYEVSVGHYEAESYKKGCHFKEDIDEVNISSDDINISIETKEKSCNDCKEETVFPTSEQTQQEIEINNVDKDTTEEVMEESLKENYSNVKFFKCNNVTCKGNNILVEGIIGFKSGKKRNTKFVFESYKTDGNTISFIEKTNDLNRKNNNMFLNGKVIKNKFISESIKLR